MISLIIPVYNEERVLLENSADLEKLGQAAELIFVDGGSNDRSQEIAKRYGTCLVCEKGRSQQMNYGSARAQGDILFFLHADAIISRDTLKSIEENIMKDGFVGGCLTQRIDKNEVKYRLLESFGNIRARLTKVFYGDQGIFVRKDIFLKSGGFPEVPLMEDVIFTKQLRKIGKTIVLADKILVSARRWEKKGFVNTVILYSFLNLLYWMRVPLEKIKLFYDDLR